MMRLKKTWISSAHQGYVDEHLHSNTLSAFKLAARKGADMIETDARMTRDGVLIVHHDENIQGYDENGRRVNLVISDTDYSVIKKISLLKERRQDNRVPTLEEALNIAYFTGMCINIDMKEGIKNAEKIAELVVRTGMRGRTVYATNGAGAESILQILKIDPKARFIDTRKNYTGELLEQIPEYPSKCYVYTGDFSNENIEEIRKSGCMLAAIAITENNAKDAFLHHPDMAEYPHTSDFETIEKTILEMY